MWKGGLAFLLLILLLIPVGVFAQGPLPATANITVTVQGYVGAAPTGLVITYVTDYEVFVSWLEGYGSNYTMVRVKYGSYPEDREDGYLAYYGQGNNFTDNNIILAGPDIPFYRAWNQNINGTWEEMGTTAEANFMSISFLFAILIILGLVLFIASFRWKDMLLSYSAALTWLGIGFWWIIGDISNFGIEESWVQILVFIPFILAFAVLLRLMNTEIVSEAKGKRWVEWGATPKEDVPDRRTTYKKLLRERMGR